MSEVEGHALGQQGMAGPIKWKSISYNTLCTFSFRKTEENNFADSKCKNCNTESHTANRLCVISKSINVIIPLDCNLTDKCLLNC